MTNQNFQAVDGADDLAPEWAYSREDRFLDASDVRRTLTDWEFYPDALEGAVRHTVRRVGPVVPILVTENGIATADDAERVEYTHGALTVLARAIADGVDVRGYLHWSLLDDYEWGSWKPTLGLVAVDRETFVRTVKPSARWYGEVARTGTWWKAGRQWRGVVRSAHIPDRGPFTQE